MAPSLFVRHVIPGMPIVFVALVMLSVPAAGAERWIPLPNQPDSYVSLNVGSIQHMPGDPVSAQVRMEVSNRADTRSLQRTFGTLRGDMADFLYTVDRRSQQFSVSRTKPYQGVLTASKRQTVNDAGWQHVDSVGLAGEVAHQLCDG